VHDRRVIREQSTTKKRSSERLVDLVDFSPALMSATLLRGTPGPARNAVLEDTVGEPAAVDGVVPAFSRAALPPALLTVANYNGTLAAVRSLGRAGIQVTTADPSRFAVSAWSKYATTRVQCPPVRATADFLEWLLAFGNTHERHVLLPTNDDSAWLYSLHREQLARYFYVAAPPVEVVYGLLNKATLYSNALDAGLDVPRTWFPTDADDVEACCREARFPVVIKPRTQVMFRTQSKGAYVRSAEELARHYSRIAGQPHERDLLTRDPYASRPMVQEFHEEAAQGIYSVSAYVSDGRICGLRAARKVLQQPRRLGIGVCFEEADVLADVAAGLERMVRRLRFSGVFEAEFILTKNHRLLIDFNPRFYNQMAFDIARGLPLPLLAYYDALGDVRSFERMCATTDPPALPRGRVFVDLISMRILLSAQRLSGVLSSTERKQWAEWYNRNRDNCTYAIIDSTDRLPVWLAVAQTVLRHSRHPRNFLRSIVLNQH
jgi:D-aspartate ligase